jgi:hypothetical protein
MTKEKKFENEVRSLLDKIGVYYFKFWGGSQKSRSGYYVSTKKGVPDLICCINGHFVGLEIKQENGEVSDVQKRNIAEINKNGGIALIVYPKDYQLLAITLEELLKGEKNYMVIREAYYKISKNL